MNNLENLKSKINNAPEKAGVYLMKDKDANILYIGKAKSLKKRLQSYLRSGLSSKTLALITNVADIEYKICQNETISLLLEAELVHKYKPKYNVLLRDDKSFPLVKVTNEEFPAVFITRKKELDGARYFGPYIDAGLLRQALKIIRRSISFCSCRKLPKTSCMYYRIGLCPAPCIGKITKDVYAKSIDNICLIFEGRACELISKLSKQMEQDVKAHNFEAAAELRDKIVALGSLGEGKASSQDGLLSLKDILGLKHIPVRIEAFDISNISGKDACGSMITFVNGTPDKNNYRRFKIKGVNKIDDYLMLREVVARRYRRVVEEKLTLPDLLLIDGGKGHLAVAKEELDKLGLNLPIISIAKEKDNIYFSGRVNKLSLTRNSEAQRLIWRIRDEAHRFALKYHHLLRRKKLYL